MTTIVKLRFPFLTALPTRRRTAYDQGYIRRAHVDHVHHDDQYSTITAHAHSFQEESQKLQKDHPCQSHRAQSSQQPRFAHGDHVSDDASKTEPPSAQFHPLLILTLRHHLLWFSSSWSHFQKCLLDFSCLLLCTYLRFPSTKCVDVSHAATRWHEDVFRVKEKSNTFRLPRVSMIKRQAAQQNSFRGRKTQ